MSSFSRTELTIIGLLVIGVVLVLPFATMGTGMMDTSWWMFDGGMFLWPLAVFGLIILGLFWAFQDGAAGTNEHPDPARAELRERYARGEIDDEEFEDRLRLLNDNR